MLTEEIRENANVLQDNVQRLVNEFTKVNGNCMVGIEVKYIINEKGEISNSVDVSVKI